MKEISKAPYFGSVYEISRETYVAEVIKLIVNLIQVTNAPKDSWVVLHLY